MHETLFLLPLTLLWPALALQFESPCHLFRDLRDQYLVPEDEASLWTCLAEFHSGLDTRKVAEGNFGLFQIHGASWCDKCGLDCGLLADDNLQDDLKCVRKIHETEGYEAWEGYNHCRSQKSLLEMDSTCASPEPTKLDRCDLARELYFNHGVAFDQVGTWVCVAEAESDLEMESRDGSSFGLFRIGSAWWCSEDPQKLLDKECQIPCEHLTDLQLDDDLQCARRIFNMTAKSRRDGDGFRAWKSYARKCSSQLRNQEAIRECFDRDPEELVLAPKTRAFTPCELAHDLLQNHQLSGDEIASLVCVALRESRLVTSSQRSAHGLGLFQLQESFCQNGDLTDLDIANDVQCALKAGKAFFESKNCSGDGSQKVLQGCDFGVFDTLTSSRVEMEPKTAARTPRSYDQCRLAQELVSTFKMPLEMAATFTCIAREESNFDPRSMTSDGNAVRLGLFRIPDTWWCSRAGESKACGPCIKLVDDDIADDVECALKIFNATASYRSEGFSAWGSYLRACSNKPGNVEAIRACFSHNPMIYMAQSPPIPNSPGQLVFHRPVEFIPDPNAPTPDQGQPPEAPETSSQAPPQFPSTPYPPQFTSTPYPIPLSGPPGLPQQPPIPQELPTYPQQPQTTSTSPPETPAATQGPPATTQRATTTTQRAPTTTQRATTPATERPAPVYQQQSPQESPQQGSSGLQPAYVEQHPNGDYIIYFSNPQTTLRVTAQVEESRLRDNHVKLTPIYTSDGSQGVSILLEPNASERIFFKQ